MDVKDSRRRCRRAIRKFIRILNEQLLEHDLRRETERDHPPSARNHVDNHLQAASRFVRHLRSQWAEFNGTAGDVMDCLQEWQCSLRAEREIIVRATEDPASAFARMQRLTLSVVGELARIHDVLREKTPISD